MDKVKKDGSVFKDRAFSNVFVYKYSGNIEDFDFDLSEINGLVKVNAKNAMNLFKNEIQKFNAEIIYNIDGNNVASHKEISLEDFLVNEGETAINKYGDILNKVIELTTN